MEAALAVNMDRDPILRLGTAAHKTLDVAEMLMRKDHVT